MDISSLYSVGAEAIGAAAQKSPVMGQDQEAGSNNLFGSIFNAAVDNLNTTNNYIADTDREKIRLAMGETENTHDLTIAMQKSSTAMTYTIAVRDKFLEAYKEIMQMQI